MLTTKKRMVTTLVALAVVLALTLVPLAGALTTVVDSTLLVSKGASGLGGNGSSGVIIQSLSADGTLVAFSSYATDLVGAPFAGGHANVFLSNTVTGTTTLVSASAPGVGGNDWSGGAVISADGTTIVFFSYATNLLATPTTGDNAFLYDVATGTTTLITKGASGTGTTNYFDSNPSISADGRFVSFASSANDLVGANTTGDYYNIFVYDAATDTTKLITTGPSPYTGANNDSWNSSLSADGSKVAFDSHASNLVGANTFGGGYSQIFVADVASGATMLVTTGASGTGAFGYSYYPALSADGSKVAFASAASDLVGANTIGGNNQIFVADVASGATTLITKGASGTGADNSLYAPSLSADGSKVAFFSAASDLVGANTTGGNYQVFVAGVASGATTLITTGASGTGANGYSYAPSLSADGSKVAFHSTANDLVGAPTNTGAQQYQVFVSTLVDKATVTFDAQNSTPTASTTVTVGSPVAAPSAPTKAGYTFAGWFTAPTGGTGWNFGDPVTADMTLYAHWTANETTPEKPGVPPTGDTALIAPLMTLALLGSSALSLAVAVERKKRR